MEGKLLRGVSTSNPEIRCTGSHHFFVALKAATPNALHVISICTSCGEAKHDHFEVMGGPIVLEDDRTAQEVTR